MTAPLDRAPVTDLPANNKGRDRTHWLYLAVIFAVIAGVIVGLTAPSTGKSLTVLGTVFVNLIKMMIAPVIFCTIVLGIGSVRKAAAVGKVGGLALAYFLTMSSVALGIGLIVGNLLSPGRDLHLRPGAVGSGAALAGQAAESHGIAGFIQQIIPRSLPSALTEGNVLQVLLVALLVGFAVQGLGPAGESILRAVENLQKLVFKVLVMVLWLAPIGAFGAIANIVATTGFNAVTNLLLLMAGFYLPGSATAHRVGFVDLSAAALSSPRVLADLRNIVVGGGAAQTDHQDETLGRAIQHGRRGGADRLLVQS